MFNVKGTRITLTRGDSARLQVSLTNETDGTEYTLADGDVLAMTLKASAEDAASLFRITADKDSTFSIHPADTNGLDFGTYVYDVQLTTAAGDVYTVIPPSTFNLEEEVSW